MVWFEWFVRQIEVRYGSVICLKLENPFSSKPEQNSSPNPLCTSFRRSSDERTYLHVYKSPGKHAIIRRTGLVLKSKHAFTSEERRFIRWQMTCRCQIFFIPDQRVPLLPCLTRTTSLHRISVEVRVFLLSAAVSLSTRALDQPLSIPTLPIHTQIHTL